MGIAFFAVDGGAGPDELEAVFFCLVNCAQKGKHVRQDMRYFQSGSRVKGAVIWRAYSIAYMQHLHTLRANSFEAVGSELKMSSNGSSILKMPRRSGTSHLILYKSRHYYTYRPTIVIASYHLVSPPARVELPPVSLLSMLTIIFRSPNS